MPTVSKSVPVAGYGDIEIEKGHRPQPEYISLRLTEYDKYDTDGEDAARIVLFSDEAEALSEAINEVRAAPLPEPEPEVTAAPEVLHYLSLGQRRSFIQAFVDSKVPLRIRYTDETGTITERTISPYSVEDRGNLRTYVFAWDHEKEAYRNFRVIRISHAAPAAEVFVAQS